MSIKNSHALIAFSVCYRAFYLMETQNTQKHTLAEVPNAISRFSSYLRYLADVDESDVSLHSILMRFLVILLAVLSLSNVVAILWILYLLLSLS